LEEELEKLETSLAKSENDNEIPDTGLSGNDNANSPVDNVETAVQVEFTPNQISRHSPTEIHLQILHVRKLIKFIDAEFFSQKQKFEDLVTDNDIRFDLLWLLFRPEKHVVFQDPMSGLPMAGEVRVIVGRC